MMNNSIAASTEKVKSSVGHSPPCPSFPPGSIFFFKITQLFSPKRCNYCNRCTYQKYQIPIRYVDTKTTKQICSYLKYEIPNGYVNTKHRQIAAALPWSSLYRARQPERYCARVVHKVTLFRYLCWFFLFVVVTSIIIISFSPSKFCLNIHPP